MSGLPRTLSGRGGECATLDGLLEGVSGGRSGSLVVLGEAGVGKTALLPYSADSAVGLRVIRAVGVESEMELAFAATSVAKAGLAEFDTLVRLNARAAFIVSREGARRLRDGGAIVNLSSSAEDSALRTHGLYAATKAVTNVLTQALALDGPCLPDRVTDVIAHLLSDHGRRLTGQIPSVGDAE